MESALCKRLAALQPSDKYSLSSPVIPSIIVVANSETPFAAKNALQDLQRHRILYHSPSISVSTLSHTDAEQRATCIQQLLSQYDNCLSEYAIHRLHIHSVAFSIRQLRTLFAHAYLFMLVCKYQSIPAEALDVADVTKQQLYSSLVQFVTERMSGATYACDDVLTCSPVVPSIPDSVVLALLEKEKPSYSVVDVTRTADWCRALSRSDEEMRELDGMIKELRERDERIRKEDMANRESREPVERRRGEAYVMKEMAAEDAPAAPAEAPKEEAKRGGLMSPKFSRMMEAESLNTSGSGYKANMERRAKEEAERVKLKEKKNLEERERMRQEEEKRQRDDEERRKAEFEAQKRKEEERQRRIEAKLAAQEAERNRKIEEQRKKQEEAARRRQEELERREEERRKREQEELEQKEREREALVEKRRQRMQEEILKKERQNQKEAAEQMKRFEEERRRIYEVSMGFDAAKYNASTARLDEQKSAEQLAREADQKKREEAVKKAREQMMAKLQQEKEQKELEKKTYQRLAELRRPAPETSEEKRQRIEEAKRMVARGKEQLKALLELKDQVKAIVTIRRKKEEEERKKKEEEEKRKREEERKRREKGIVLNAEDFAGLSDHLTSITVNACENYQQEILDFSRFKELETLKIGGNCFNYPSIVSIVDLTHLKHIEIGEYSFQDNSSEAELVVSGCSSLVSLAIGSHSFSHFKVFKVSDLPSLETLEMGSDCFREADFKMKNMETVKTVRLGDTSFQRSRHTVIEGVALDERVMTRVFKSAGGRAGRVLLERREERAL